MLPLDKRIFVTESLSEKHCNQICSVFLFLEEKIGLSSIGMNFINTFLIFAFSRVDKEMKRDPFSSVFSKTKIEDYFKISDEHLFYLQKKVEDYSLHLEKIQEIKQKDNKTRTQNIIECFGNGFKYDRKNTICDKCRYKPMCLSTKDF